MSKELVKKAQKGNKVALNELINRHRQLAFTIAFKYLKNREDAEDIVQNSFIIVLKHIGKFRNEAKFSTWLYRIVYHECLKELKNKNNRSAYVPQFYTIQEQEEEDNSFEFNNIISVLNSNEYLVISLFYLKEKSIKEIMKITSLSNANIKTILHRARKKMKENYQKNIHKNERSIN